MEKLELLPFHTLGNFKYDNLKIKNPMGKTEDLSKERLDYFQKIIDSNKNL
jgi:pyruvate-formate lyase-activating enzyme